MECILLADTDKRKKLFVMHDGGADDDYGSFGWVIATDDNILWEGWGPARCNRSARKRTGA